MTILESNYILTKSIFEANIKKINNDIAASKYPETHKALFFGQMKIDNLLTGIEILNNQSKEDHFYSIQVTTRVLFEHFIIGHYIWTKTRIEKNDNCGVEYYTHYRLSELLKRENYDLGIEGIEKNIKNNTTFENLQKRFIDHEHPIEQTDIEEIHRIGNQFEIKSILNYIINKIPENDLFKEANKNFSHFLREYNKLSSFIHNGPSAELESFHNQPIVNKNKKITESIQYGKIGSRLLKEHIMMLLLEERPEYIKLLEPIMNLKRGTK